jgi:hypothetical protein
MGPVQPDTRDTGDPRDRDHNDLRGHTKRSFEWLNMSFQ